LRPVNPQSMRRRYKNIAGLTCYIQLNSKTDKTTSSSSPL
jgi:hypothetical protein